MAMGVLGQPLNTKLESKIQTSREDRRTHKSSPSTKSETRKAMKKIDQTETPILTYQNSKKDKQGRKTLDTLTTQTPGNNNFELLFSRQNESFQNSVVHT